MVSKLADRYGVPPRAALRSDVQLHADRVTAVARHASRRRGQTAATAHVRQRFAGPGHRSANHSRVNRPFSRALGGCRPGMAWLVVAAAH